jgi:hypothetical protein
MKLRTLALVAALLAGQPALAHHSFAPFDLAREITLVGTIKKCSSPARTSGCRCWCRVRGGGQTEWSIEAGAPGMLLRTGWKSNTLKAGDRVTIVTHPPEAAHPLAGPGTSDARRRASLRPGRSAPAHSPRASDSPSPGVNRPN